MFDFDAFGNLVVYQWLGLSPQDKFGSALQFFVADTPKILLLLAVAIFVITVIRSYFPTGEDQEVFQSSPQYHRQHLGRAASASLRRSAPVPPFPCSSA